MLIWVYSHSLSNGYILLFSEHLCSYIFSDLRHIVLIDFKVIIHHKYIQVIRKKYLQFLVTRAKCEKFIYIGYQDN